MKLLDFNWNPTDRQLRQFSAIAMFAMPLVGWLWGATGTTLAAIAGVGVLLAVVGFVVPKLIQPLFVALMVIATPVGLVIGELSMILIFFGMFLPLGLVFRLMGRDALNLKIDRNATSYWHAKKQPENVASYYRQS